MLVSWAPSKNDTTIRLIRDIGNEQEKEEEEANKDRNEQKGTRKSLGMKV